MAIQGIGSTSTTQSISRGLKSSHDAMARNIERLSSGKSINRAADNAAGLAIANQLLSELSASGKATQNIDYGISQADVADGAMATQSDIVVRMRELALQSANDTMSDSARGVIQTEFSQLQEELGRIAETTEFAGQALLQGGQTEIQVGTGSSETSRIEIGTPDTSVAALGLENTDLSTSEGARVALDAFDVASESLSTERAKVGAVRNRLQGAKEGTEISMENIAAAASRVSDTDVAAELTELSLNRVRHEITAKLQTRQSISAGMLVDLVG